MARDECIAGVGRPWKPVGERRQRTTAGQQAQQRCDGPSGRPGLAAGCNQVPGVHPSLRVDGGQQAFGHGLLQRDWTYAVVTIPGEEPAQRPAAEAAITVVEQGRALALAVHHGAVYVPAQAASTDSWASVGRPARSRFDSYIALSARAISVSASIASPLDQATPMLA
ncbi:MAG: hypothetical protein QOC91_951 [Solirubrobacteraceae bacterium]|jgi:hypothetical protein|nr:hypothetical protein [Solirubrobacteraceae bacterium]